MTIKSKRPRWEKGGKCHLFIVHCVCLQPKDLSADKEFLLNLAPGEGKKPVGMFSDKHNEQ
jgi:DTW domain-containing protein YfiP